MDLPNKVRRSRNGAIASSLNYPCLRNSNFIGNTGVDDIEDLVEAKYSLTLMSGSQDELSVLVCGVILDFLENYESFVLSK